jgi:hypothetical protein
LPSHFDELARGEKLRRPPPGPGRIRDPRVSGLIPGVTNRDARAVYDARLVALEAAVKAGDDAALARGLCEMVYLKLWRARALAGFDALAQAVIGVEPERARALAKQAGGEDLEPLNDAVVALWLRTETTLNAIVPGARVMAGHGPSGLELCIALPLEQPLRNLDALEELGKRVSSLRRLL